MAHPPLTGAADWAARGWSRRLADTGAWLASAALVAAAFWQIAAWAMQVPAPVASVNDGPPPAIMVELAPMPSTTEAAPTEISPDVADAAASRAALDVPEAEPAPTEPLRDEPVQDLTEPLPLPEIETADAPPDTFADMELPPDVPGLAEVETAEVSLALPRSMRPPERPERAAPEVKPEAQPLRREPPPQQKSAASDAARKSRAEVPVTPQEATPKSAGRGSSMSPARWGDRVLARIERNKPRGRGAAGTVVVRFAVDAAGNLSAIAVARSSGNPALDEAVMVAARRASPVPPPPPGISGPQEVTVRFDG